MNIQTLPLQKLPFVRGNVIRFIRRYGEKRITHQAIQWIQQLDERQEAPGTLIVVATESRQLIAITVFSNYGLGESLIVVHPDFRKQGVGDAIVQYSLQQLPKVYARVATDNIPSLKLCFSNGLVAFQVFKGPTGKPTLWLGGGNWRAEEIAN